MHRSLACRMKALLLGTSLLIISATDADAGKTKPATVTPRKSVAQQRYDRWKNRMLSRIKARLKRNRWGTKASFVLAFENVLGKVTPGANGRTRSVEIRVRTARKIARAEGIDAAAEIVLRFLEDPLPGVKTWEFRADPPRIVK